MAPDRLASMSFIPGHDHRPEHRDRPDRIEQTDRGQHAAAELAAARQPRPGLARLQPDRFEPARRAFETEAAERAEQFLRAVTGHQTARYCS